jgi:hypothetical protein
MSNKPTAKKSSGKSEPKIEIQQAQVPTFYVNFARAARSNYEITFTVGKIKEISKEKITLEEPASLIMSVEYFKTFAKFIRRMEEDLEKSKKGE